MPHLVRCHPAAVCRVYQLPMAVAARPLLGPMGAQTRELREPLRHQSHRSAPRHWRNGPPWPRCPLTMTRRDSQIQPRRMRRVRWCQVGSRWRWGPSMEPPPCGAIQHQRPRLLLRSRQRESQTAFVPLGKIVKTPSIQMTRLPFEGCTSTQKIAIGQRTILN